MFQIRNQQQFHLCKFLTSVNLLGKVLAQDHKYCGLKYDCGGASAHVFTSINQSISPCRQQNPRQRCSSNPEIWDLQRKSSKQRAPSFPSLPSWSTFTAPEPLPCPVPCCCTRSRPCSDLWHTGIWLHASLAGQQSNPGLLLNHIPSLLFSLAQVYFTG